MSDIKPSTIIVGDCLSVLRTLPDESVQCCVTSPPYFGLRDYGMEGQIGLEPTPAAFVAAMVEVFREVRRVLRNDGTCWLNLGDSYAGSSGGGFRPGAGRADGVVDQRGQRNRNGLPRVEGVKPKDLIGIPWRVAFALQDDGWYLRCDVVWSKPNPMPESVTDRPTKSHEYLFLLSKSPRYYYDHESIRELSVTGAWDAMPPIGGVERPAAGINPTQVGNTPASDGMRNKRSVWTVAPRPFKGAHFATFPVALITPCILAGCPPGGVVLDPFGGAGTVGVACKQTGRNSLLIELNPDYARMAEARIAATPAVLPGTEA